MAVEVKITDNSKAVLAAAHEQIQAALEAIGNQAVSHAKQNIGSAGRVDTGALMNSMNHLVEDDVCYVGTNQGYAIYNEIGTGIYADGGGGRQTPWAYQDGKGEWHRTSGMAGIHFLRDAVADNVSEYKSIAEQILRG